MLLTIDIGNSNIVATLFNDKKEILKQARDLTIKNDVHGSYSIYARKLKSEFDLKDINYVVSCVVPAIILEAKAAFKNVFNSEGIWIDYQTYPGISKLLDPPEEIGADLIASSVEIIENLQQPAVIVDMGTANKVILVQDDTIQGVIISPGVGVLRDSITASIPHLPEVPLAFPKELVGRTTIDSIQSGIMYFTLDSILGIVQDLETKMNVTLNKFVTGGYARFFYKKMTDYRYDEDLVSKGLYTMFHQEMCDAHD